MIEKISYLKPDLITKVIQDALAEDLGPGDYSTLASIDEDTHGEASIIIKGKGVLAGIEVAKQVFAEVDQKLQVNVICQDGAAVDVGDLVLTVIGNARSILSSERLVLNMMQRMSGIATKTKYLCSLIEGTNACLLDTRKTTPNFRMLEKWAVKIGGGENHRFALYDMIILKDNHIDYAGGIINAVSKARKFLDDKNLDLKIEVETRTINEVAEALDAKVDIIMLDNMSINQLDNAVSLVNKKCRTEASGGIDADNIREVAKTGVDYISVGALTHSYQSLDMSLIARIDS